MSIVFSSRNRDPGPWVGGIQKLVPEERVEIWPVVLDPDSVQTVVVWNHHIDLFKKLKNVKLVASMGAGVDHIFKDPLLPKDAFVTRIINESLSWSMSNFCLAAVLSYHKRLHIYREDQRNHVWDQKTFPEIDISVGIMGLGVLGSDLAQKLKFLGFEVYGLSKSRKSIEGIKSYVLEEKEEFLSQINVLVNLLPMTEESKGILNIDLFSKMNRGTYLINVARGPHQVDDDIIKAIDRGYLSGAFLDVFPEEPLPNDHVFWNHPKIQVTPHIASITNPEAAIPQIVENHLIMKKGGIPINLADRVKGY